MKIIPAQRAAAVDAAKKQQKTEEITRWIALAIAFFGTFFFFIKLLFL